MRRRRALSVLAAAALLPAAATTKAAAERRVALGAETELTLFGPPAATARARRRAWAEMARMEALFDLHDPASALARLNATGRLDAPPRELLEVLALCDRLQRATAGRFDPTVQPLWRALATGGDVEAARGLVGWDGVRWDEGGVTLGPRQQLTLNGIAQGYATDRVTAILTEEGLTRALVEMGEFRALGGPFRLGVEDPAHGRLGQVTLDGAACATSSPGAMTLPGGESHILDPQNAPGGGAIWSTVSVTAPSAALADGLSTALCLADEGAARGVVAAFGDGIVARLVTPAGDLFTL